MTVASGDKFEWTTNTTMLCDTLCCHSCVCSVAACMCYAYVELKRKVLALCVAAQAGVSPLTFSASTAISRQPGTVPGLQGTAAGRPGRAGSGGPHPRIGRGQHHPTAHSNWLPAPVSTNMQKQQPGVAAAPYDRHRQQQRSLYVVEPDPAVQLASQKVCEPQQQQVQSLQRDAGSRHGGADAAPQSLFAAQPEQTCAGERSFRLSIQFVAKANADHHFLRTNALDHACRKGTKQGLFLSASYDQWQHLRLVCFWVLRKLMAACIVLPQHCFMCSDTSQLQECLGSQMGIIALLLCLAP